MNDTLQYGDTLLGKTVASVEIRDSEVLIAFAEGGEIAVALSETGGDYPTPIFEISIS